MLRIDETGTKLVAPRPGTLVKENLKERGDLQRLIVSSWSQFVDELGFPSLRFLGQEVRPHIDVADRIDLLGFDEDEGRAVIIELKRSSHKLQLLQALSYAAMVSTWGTGDYRNVVGASADADLLNSIEHLDDFPSPQVVLIAEEFEPQVILTAHWLSSTHNVDIYCFSLTVQRFNEDRLLSFHLDYPIRQIGELYRRRSDGGGGKADPGSSQTWADVAGWISYDWGKPVLEFLKAQGKEGDPKRRRFTSLFPGDWGSFRFTFHKEDLGIVIYGRREGDVAHWRNLLPDDQVTTWGSEESKTEGLRLKLCSSHDASAFFGAIGQQPDFGSVHGKETNGVRAATAD